MKTSLNDYALAKRLQHKAGNSIASVGYDGDTKEAFGDAASLTAFKMYLDEAKVKNTPIVLLEVYTDLGGSDPQTIAGLQQMGQFGVTVFGMGEVFPSGSYVQSMAGITATPTIQQVIDHMKSNLAAWHYDGDVLGAY